MTKKEVKERIQNINWRDDDEDIYKKIVSIVEDYQTSGEDNKLEGVLDNYLDESAAIDYIQKIAFDEGVEAVHECVDNICNFTHVYHKDAWGYLEDADLDSLCDEILDLLGLDRYSDDDEEDDEEDD